MNRTTRLMLLVVAVPVALGACKKKPVVQAATPVTTEPPRNPVSPPVTPPTNNTPSGPTAAEIEARETAAARAILTDIINFEYDSDQLTPEARAKLDAKLALMNANPAVRVRIEGHCDERGTDEYNLVLGRRRAEIAKRYLTDRGIDASRIETMSFGRERPIATGSSEDAWAQNRRDQFSIIEGGAVLKPAAR
jgi:peptidoglycan-associated lipoprotein